jgi:hypothetical protein
MKPLDDYIRKNLDRFDSDEPLQGHFDRFSDKLDRTGSRTRDRSIGFIILRIAAILILASIITFGAIREFKIFTWQSEQLSAAEYPELIEAEKFYTNQLDQYYSKLQSLKFNNDKVQKKQILDELSDMDHQVKTMKRDLIQNPDDERIVHAIINFYQTKLEIMDMIITRTQEYSSTIL